MKMNEFRWRSWVLPLIGVVLLAIFPVIGIPRSWILYLFLFYIYLAMANMWNLLAGYSGLMSLCQPAFIGLAGYTLIVITWANLPFYVGIIGGAIVAALFAVIISVPVFRLKGVYFAIGTLVVPEVLRIIFYLWRPVGSMMQGGGAGYTVKGLGGITMTEIYWLALAIGVLSVLLVHLILRSKLGLGLAAVRDNERTASSSGINVFRLKFYTFIISALVTGAAGGIFYIYQGFIEPASAFNISWTMTVVLATVIGGMGSELGPVIGAVIVVVLHFVLGKFSGISMLVQGVILVGIILLAPQGLLGLVTRSRVFRKLVRLVNERLAARKSIRAV